MSGATSLVNADEFREIPNRLLSPRWPLVTALAYDEALKDRNHSIKTKLKNTINIILQKCVFGVLCVTLLLRTEARNAVGERICLLRVAVKADGRISGSSVKPAAWYSLCTW